MTARCVLTCVVVLFVFGSVANPAAAGPNGNAKITLHLAPATTKNACTRTEARPPCADMVTAGDLSPQTWFAYVLVTDASAAAGLTGLQFGVDYDGSAGSGVDVHGWSLCATLEFPTPGWPTSGSGNLVTWSTCQTFEPGGPGTGVIAVAGYLYIEAFSPDILRITPRPVDGFAKVADCASIEDTLVVGSPPSTSLGEAAFSSGAVTPGFNPCGADVGLACLITGPATVAGGSLGNIYSLDTPPPASASLQWSVTGNATVSGSSTGSSALVNAGISGSFVVNVGIDDGVRTTSCSRSIGIDSGAPPDCAITGSGLVLTGTTELYSVTSPAPGAVFTWSISGNGTIVGSNAGPSISVEAGASGTFQLEVEVTAGGPSGFCGRTVIVQAPTCTITGPDSVYEFTTGYQFTAVTPGTSFLWSISGNGSIPGDATVSTVSVTSGAAGMFTLTLISSAGGEADTCERVVRVVHQGTEGPRNAGAKILLHVTSVSTKNLCTRPEALPSCNQIVTQSAALYPTFHIVYLLLTDGFTNGTVGVGGIQCGIEYDGSPGHGIDVFSWRDCGSISNESTGWPASGGGNLVTFGCQKTEPGGAGTGVTVTAGYFYMSAYSQDAMRVVPRPIDGFARVFDCGSIYSTLQDPSLGRVGFGGVTGYNPCGLVVVPVKNVTWSSVKALYAH